jgi:FkbM family methyltransferase
VTPTPLVPRLLALMLRRGGNLLHKLSLACDGPKPSSPERQMALKRWFEDGGDRRLRLDYPLNEDSLVFDLGGYQGQWTSDIFACYQCYVHVFEPIARYARSIEDRFAKNAKIIVHCCGLASENMATRISLSEDGSSIFADADNYEMIQLCKASEFISSRGIRKISLMKVNIEGAEYDLIDHLISSGVIRSVENLQVQFHEFVLNAEERMACIHRLLSETHSLTWQYEFVWENWRLKQ